MGARVGGARPGNAGGCDAAARGGVHGCAPRRGRAPIPVGPGDRAGGAGRGYADGCGPWLHAHGGGHGVRSGAATARGP